ncbi:glycosyltransferase 87 family protein [Calidifontibacter terrae]
MTTDPRRRLAWAGAILLILASAFPLMWQHLVAAHTGRWQVDLDVYRTAGVSHLIGRPVYDALTQPPQLLPFTYPPFASMLAVPLALVPFKVTGWIWWFTQALADCAIVWLVGRRWWGRPQWWAPLAYGAATAVGLHLLPVSDGLRFGQVDAFLMLIILVDLLRVRGFRWLPSGVGVGLAVAIKLTPGVFLIWFLVTKQWRSLRTATATAAGATLFAYALDPTNSTAFWFGALLDPERLGHNDTVANQSIRGALLRLHLDGAAGSLLWLLLSAAVLWLGMTTAKRAYETDRLPAAIAAVAITGLLISPVSWIHHHDWVLLILPVLVTFAGRRPLGWAVVATVFVIYLLKWPWWAYWAAGSPTTYGTPWPFTAWIQVVGDTPLIAAVIALCAVARYLRSERAASPSAESAA